MLMAGSAMCEPTNGCGDSYEIDGINIEGTHIAGDILNITTEVCYCCCEVDFDNVTVTANFSEFGASTITLELDEEDEDCAEYTGSIVLTSAQKGCIEVIVAYNGEVEDSRDDICFDIDPDDCAQLRIRSTCGDDPETKALTQLWFCEDYTCVDWWWNSEYHLYHNEYSVYGYDAYDNCIGPINMRYVDCCECFTATIDSPASLKYRYRDGYPHWWNRNYITVYNDQYAADVVLRVHCVGGDVEGDELTISFLQPVSNMMSVTSDVDFVYASEYCENEEYYEGECYNISVQLRDIYGEPVLMPGVDVRLFINNDFECTDETDENGTVSFEEICIGNDEVGSIDIRAEAECREGSLELPVIAPVLGAVEIEADSPVMCGDEQQLTYTCTTDHGSEMCCPKSNLCDPNIIWTSDAIGDVDEDGYFTALDSGTAVVEVNVSGVIGTVEIVINCSKNCSIVDECPCCQYNPIPFVLSSGSVTLTGNHTDVGHACLMALGDPILEWNNDTRGAIVDMKAGTVANVTLDLNGTGDMWIYNETTGNWSKYADGDTAEVVSDGRCVYALVTPGEPVCTDVTISPAGPFDIYVGNAFELTANCTDQYGDEIECSVLDWHSDNMTVGEIISGVFEAYAPGTANVTASGCGVSNSVRVNVTVDHDPEPTPTATTKRSSRGGGGGGTYPPDPVPTPTPNATDNETDQDDPKPAEPTPAEAKPTVNLPGGDTTLDTTPDDTEDEAPGGADPTNAILLVLALLAVCVIGYVIYRRSQN